MGAGERTQGGPFERDRGKHAEDHLDTISNRRGKILPIEVYHFGLLAVDPACERGEEQLGGEEVRHGARS